MNNINTQVSPRNGVDFSKIRKAQQGIKIPKFLNPYQGLTLTLGEYNTRKNVYGAKDDFFTNGLYDFAKMYEYYKAHPELFKDLSLITATPLWENAVRNTKGFKDWNSQFNNTGLNYFFGYDASKADYFGPTTSARKAFLDYINHQNNLPELTSEEIDITSGGTNTGGNNTVKNNTIENNTVENNEISERTYTPEKFTPPFKFKPQPFTSFITNGVIAGLGLAANRRVYNNEMQKKVPLLEAPHHQYITGSYKATVDAYNKAGSEIQTQANVIASNSSDLRLSQNILLAGAKEAAEKRLEGTLKQQEGYNQDRKEALNTAYFNSDAANRIANINRLNLVADWNRRLDAKSKYLMQRNAILADNLMKIRTDYGNWKANEENERDAALSAYNQHLANLDMRDAKKPYQNLLANPTQSNAFNQVYSNAFRDFNSNRETNANWRKNNQDLIDIFKTGTDVDKRNAFLTYLQTHGDSDYGKLFTRGYNSELTTLKNKYIQDAEDIQTDLSALAPSFRNTYTTEGWYNPKRLGKQYQRRFAEGGILKMKRGSRFVDYLEHNRKALRDQKLTTMENVKQAQKTLQHQLEAIDRETLILLRSIFK